LLGLQVPVIALSFFPIQMWSHELI
jgi:hypothetical protein